MQQRSGETRSRILISALHVFSQTGYDGSGVAEICSAAGVSKGAFYHHFPSKQAVFLELLHLWLADLDQRLNDVQLESMDVPETLISMSAMLKNIFQDADRRLPMFLEFWTQASRDPVIWQETIAPYDRYQQYFSALIRKGIAQGSLEEVDPEAAARLIVSIAIGTLLQGLLDPKNAQWDTLGQQEMEILIHGLEKRKT